MTDSVAKETRTSSERPNAAPDFFGSLQCTSCEAVCVRSLSEDEELLEDDEESAMFQLFGLQV